MDLACRLSKMSWLEIVGFTNMAVELVVIMKWWNDIAGYIGKF